MSKKKFSRAQQIQHKQWLAANPHIADIKVDQLNVKKKVGRNDPCPCGSGLKSKKCKCTESG